MTIERSPTFAQGFRRVLERALRDVHTAMPGEVVAFDAAAQTVDVRPLLRLPEVNEAGDVELVELPVLPAVPVVFPGAGGFRATFPVRAGDGVLLVFLEADASRWQALGGLQDASSPRRFHVADAVAIPGLKPNTAPWTGVLADGATFAADGAPGVVATAAGLELGALEGQRATEPVILGQTYRTAEDAAIDALVSQLTATSAALGTALASLATAVTANATPVVGGLLAAAPLGVVVTQLGVVLAQVTAATAALQAFKAAAAPTLSAVVRTR